MIDRYLLTLLVLGCCQLLPATGSHHPISYVTMPPAVDDGGTTLPAEGGRYGGGCRVDSDHEGARGSGHVNFPPNGGYLDFTGIDGGAGGEATLRIRYALGNNARTGELVINGTVVPLTLTGTGAWSQWTEVYLSVSLSSGSDNTISLRSTGQDFGNVDEITVWEESRHSCDYERLALDGRWSANYWESEIFEGQVCRVAATDASTLYAAVDHTYGGWDMAIAYNYKDYLQVDDVPADLRVDGRITVDLTTVDRGRWWAGPKLAVRAAGSSGLPGNYENYVIENASISPEEVHEWRMNPEGAVYLGTTTHDGATYKHYYNPHKEWYQYWAVRQQYRTQGAVSMRPILQKWREHGMRNDFIRNMRINIEASSNSQGSVVMSDFATPLPGQPAAESGRILIRAKSSQGGEIMRLEVDGSIVKSWDNVSRAGADYTYDGYRGGVIKIVFDDNGGSRAEGTDRNLGIDYIEVCGIRYQSDTDNVTRTGCGTDNYQNYAWLYCNGNLDFGNLNCNIAALSLPPVASLQRVDDAAFDLYPNPAHGHLTVVSSFDYDLTLYDVGGRMVLRERHAAGQSSVAIGQLRPGVYIVDLVGVKGDVLRERVVIK